MTTPIIVDSAVYIEHLRAGVDIRQVLIPYLNNGDLYNCGIIRAEVLRGFKNAQLRKEMKAFFDIVPEVPTTSKTWHEIADFAWEVDRSVGGNRPLTDLIIAHAAIQIGAVLISPDQHFQDLPGLKVRAELS